MRIYRVEIDDPGCSQCQHDQNFSVIGPDGVASSTSYGDEDEAISLARALDHAYELGQQSVKVVATDPWTSFATQKPPESRHLLVWDAQFQGAAGIYYMAEVYTDEHLAAMRYTHWMLAAALPGPRDVSQAEQPPAIAAAPTTEPPTLQPAPAPEETRVISDWDDTPF